METEIERGLVSLRDSRLYSRQNVGRKNIAGEAGRSHNSRSCGGSRARHEMKIIRSMLSALTLARLRTNDIIRTVYECN